MKNKQSNKGLSNLLRRIKFPKLLFSFGIVFTIFGVIFSLLLPLEVRTFVDKASTGFSGKVLLSILVLLVGSTLFDVLGSYVLGVAGQKIVSQLRSHITSHLLLLPVTFFDHTRSAEISSHLSNDTQKINDLVSRNISSLVSGIFLTVGSIVILVTISPLLTTIILAALVIMALLLAPISKKESILQQATQNELGKYSADLQQSISEIRLIKTSTAEKPVTANLKKRISRLYHTNLKITTLNSILNPIEFTLIMGTLFFAFVVGGSLVSRKVITIGALTSFLIYVFQILTPLASISTTVTAFKSADGAAAALVQILDEPVEVDDSSTNVETTLPEDPKSLVFEDADFSYESPDKKTIKDLSLDIEPNNITAFVGPSGGGKSTILSLIERFYHLDNGQITYNNIPLNSISLEEWRKSISYVSQETSMLFGTIRDNLTFGLKKIPSDKELFSALHSASALSFVKALPEGLDTKLYEQAQNISGGQIQRLMIARAFLKKAPIIIFDEATANLDSASERDISQSINQLRGNHTIITVAHRLATVKNADKIFFIDDGQVTGAGTHQELLKTHKLYRQYVDEQLI